MLGRALEVLFPRRCVGCGSHGWPFCRACLPEVAVFAPPWCERCGRPLRSPVPGCGDCPPVAIAWARSAYLYEGPVRRALMRLKFGGMRSVADAFAGAMASAWDPTPSPPGWSRCPPRGPAPVLTWVPLGTRRRRARGYDQAEILARAVGHRRDAPVVRLLERARETDPQARRVGAERRAAMAGAFRARGRPPDRVVVVDDVLTSGATAAECAATLIRAGANEGGVLTAARSLGGPVPERCYTPRSEPWPGSVVAREIVSR